MPAEARRIVAAPRPSAFAVLRNARTREFECLILFSIRSDNEGVWQFRLLGLNDGGVEDKIFCLRVVKDRVVKAGPAFFSASPVRALPHNFGNKIRSARKLRP